MDEAFSGYYATGSERDRLGGDGGETLEFVRTLELLAQILPPAPAVVVDVGGGPGAYASRFAQAGYAVRLLDVVPLHVEQARAAAAELDVPFEAEVGDARDLSRLVDESADAVLLLGPLYHLTQRDDRVRALSEARRVLRPGGAVAAVAISHLASLCAGIARGYLEDPRFVSIVERDLREGQHRNPENVEGWFTTAYFHTPAGLQAEVEEAGLAVERLVGIEGPGGWLGLWPERRELAMRAARLAEDAPALSAHMLCVARPAVVSR